jgi:hypothetical protein
MWGESHPFHRNEMSSWFFIPPLAKGGVNRTSGFMEIFKDMGKTIEIILTFTNANATAISLIFVMVGGIFAWIKFREYLRDKRFETYHKLIDELVDERSHSSGNLKLDRQVAIIFELRNFPRYFEVTQRILKALKVTWKGNKRLVDELEYSLNYIEKNRRHRLFRT